MSYSVHILRQTGDGQETPVTMEEWNAYIDQDGDLKRPGPEHPDFRNGVVFLPVEAAGPDDWQSLRWVSGSILSDYPQQPMMKKIGQIARHFGAVVMSDDGDIWIIDDDGQLSMEGF